MLTKLQKKYLNEIENAFLNLGDTISFTDDEYVKYQDIFHLLEQRKIIQNIHASGVNIYYQIGSFETFNTWLKDIEKEERRLSFREWKIAIIGESIASIIGIIPRLIALLK